MRIHAQEHKPGAALHINWLARHAIGNQSDRALPRLNAGDGKKVESGTPAQTGGGHDFSRIPLHSQAPVNLQAKLDINAPGDAYEQEADRVADQVMRTPGQGPQRGCACGGDCPKCQTQQQGRPHGQVQLKPVGPSGPAQIAAPPIVRDVLASPGRPLDAATRAFMEPRFGHDFSRVRIHTDQTAVQSAEAVAAHAYTVGTDVVFGAGRYLPESSEGQRLLAHELAHVVQQQEGAGATPSLQRFVDKERDKIAPTFGDMLATIRAIIDASTTSGLISDSLNMGSFVEKSGGQSASRKMDKAVGSEQPTIKSMLLPRYLFTCRCGLIDMRHFIQLFYISNFAAGFEGVSQSGANRYATRKGREHELEAESQSRFSAEDTTSNALGAFTNIGLAAMPGPDAVFDAIKETLTRCSPIDFKSLSITSQDTVVNFYGAQIPDPKPKKPGDRISLHQNQTAVPDVLDIKECGGTERSFPFELDTSDTDRKTISDTNFGKGSTGLKSGRDIRSFINTQRPEVLKALPTSEKIRMLKVLLSDTVSDDDLSAATLLDSVMTPAEKALWQLQLPLPT